MGRRWSNKEDKKLKELVKKGLTAKEIGNILNRTDISIFNRIKKNGLRLSQAPIPEKINDYLDILKYVWNRRIKTNLEKNKNNCFEWKGAKDSKGYGQINILNKKHLVHRVSKEIALNKKLKKVELVCHKCDNPACCNPDHLFVGTQKDNVQDMWNKNRQGGQFKKGHKWPEEIKPKGEQIGKLKTKEVRRIRKIYKNTNKGYKKIAKLYDVTPSTIKSIIKRKTWKHI